MKLPHSKEAEMLVLGSMLSDAEALYACKDILQPEDFFIPEHQVIYATIQKLFPRVDTFLVCQELQREECKELDISYVADLVQYSGTSTFAEEYARLVKNKALTRQVIQITQNILSRAYQDPNNCDEFIQNIIENYRGIKSNDSKSGHIKQIIEQRLEEYKQPEQSKLPTGFIDLDAMLDGGMTNTNFIVLAARTGLGKTMLAINIACNVAAKFPVAIFSLEMSAGELVDRILSSHSNIPASRIKYASTSPDDSAKISQSVKQLGERDIYINDQGSLSIGTLCAAARALKLNHGIKLLVVDYIQLLSGSRSDNRQEEVAEISRRLKGLACELKVPILCVAQLSRKVAERAGHRPMVSDLRESGAIEQDANSIWLLDRRDYYDPNERPGEAILDVAKNRGGKEGLVPLNFQKELCKFVNATK